jgi:hypothetical protein
MVQRINYVTKNTEETDLMCVFINHKPSLSFQNDFKTVLSDDNREQWVER